MAHSTSFREGKTLYYEMGGTYFTIKVTERYTNLTNDGTYTSGTRTSVNMYIKAKSSSYAGTYSRIQSESHITGFGYLRLNNFTLTTDYTDITSYVSPTSGSSSWTESPSATSVSYPKSGMSVTIIALTNKSVRRNDKLTCKASNIPKLGKIYFNNSIVYDIYFNSEKIEDLYLNETLTG